MDSCAESIHEFEGQWDADSDMLVDGSDKVNVTMPYMQQVVCI